MSNSDRNEVLSRQTMKKNPLVSILLGFVCKSDAMQGKSDSENLSDYVEDLAEYVDSLGKAGLYESLVLKLQIPLSSSAEIPMALAYNKDKRLLQELTIDEGYLAYSMEVSTGYLYSLGFG